MRALIHGWRKDWGQGDFPFLYVQKPSGGGTAYDLTDPVTNQGDQLAPLPVVVPADGQYREEHLKIMQYPNTAMAISTDLGGHTHPDNKSGYGTRASRVALATVYGKPLEYYGPLYQSYQVEGNKIRIAFTHVGQGLAVPPGQKLQGFALAGPGPISSTRRAYPRPPAAPIHGRTPDAGVCRLVLYVVLKLEEFPCGRERT